MIPYSQRWHRSHNSQAWVRVGHIGAVGYMKNGEKILEISRKELWKDGVLDEDFDI
ncbi:hypothetical protein TELCIR_22708, partial [Teladorsagia circumcincta]